MVQPPLAPPPAHPPKLAVRTVDSIRSERWEETCGSNEQHPQNGGTFAVFHLLTPPPVAQYDLSGPFPL